MADVVSKEKRSLMMSGIKGKDTKPELLVRKGLHKLGFRYKLHSRKLPGKPDLVFSKYNAVLFVNGCFWHMHTCHLFKMPSSRIPFWKKKLNRNMELDAKALAELKKRNIRVCIIWECALKGKHRLELASVLQSCSDWLESENSYLEIKGSQ
jgi:DNA mismatch endonuclease (patch repair protein)